MLQAHKGYIQEDGRFVLSGDTLIKLPKNRLVTILWDDEPTERFTTQQLDNIQGVLESIQNRKREGFSEEEKEAFALWDSGEFKWNSNKGFDL